MGALGTVGPAQLSGPDLLNCFITLPVTTFLTLLPFPAYNEIHTLKSPSQHLIGTTQI